MWVRQWRIYIVKFWTRSRSNFLHFHAVFRKNWPNIRLAPTGKSWIRTCLEPIKLKVYSIMVGFSLWIRGGSRILRRRGRQPWGGTLTYNFAKFYKNTHTHTHTKPRMKLRTFWAVKGAPPRFSNVDHLINYSLIELHFSGGSV